MATITEASPRMHNPPHPGEILRDLYLSPLGVTITQAADALGVSRKHVSAIVNGSASLTPDMAARLGVVLKTGADLWINLQAQFDIWTLAQAAPPKLKALAAA